MTHDSTHAPAGRTSAMPPSDPVPATVGGAVSSDPTLTRLRANVRTTSLAEDLAHAEYERAVHALDDYEVSQGLPSILAGVRTSTDLTSQHSHAHGA